MKILRVRRGFTTNSSSASDWSSPPKGANSATPRPTSATPALGAEQTPLPVGATVELAPAQPSPHAQASASASGESGLGTVGLLGLGGAVFAVILGDRFVRFLIGRSRRNKP
jgi:hypothetical protein